MAEGAHFLSDVVFAGVAMALTAAGVHVLFDIIKSATGAELAAAMEIQRRRGNDRVRPTEMKPA